MVLNSCSTEINKIKQDLTKKEKSEVFSLLRVHCNLTLTVKTGEGGGKAPHVVFLILLLMDLENISLGKLY